MEPQGALKPVLKSTDFQYGLNTGIKSVKMFPNGCLLYAPVFESQIGRYFDAYWCVSESFANQCEVFFDRWIELGTMHDSKLNWLKKSPFWLNGRVRFSNRYLAIRSGTDPNYGNSGGNVAYCARHGGLAPLVLCDWNLEEKDPIKNTKANLYDESTINPEADKWAKEFSEIFDIQYEWVNLQDLEKASQEGVVQVYILAWYKNGDKYYSPQPGKSGHAIGFGQYSSITIIDQYQPQFKQIRAVSDFYPIALKINITEKSMEKPELKNNTLVQLVSGVGGFGMYLDGFIFVDDVAKILATWLVRTNGKTEGLIKPLIQEQWDMFEKKNLKDELI
ncbi:MAG: hypothetical protein WC938_03585 [Candidatus Paceibacterota bacterium]|jgi:hypothetical protein